MNVASSTLVPVAEYLSHTYHPDREFVEGVLLERNVGEIGHGNTQTRIAAYVVVHEPAFWASVEIRVQLRPDRFRVPDVVIVRGAMPEGRIITAPPEVAVEVLSPEDRAGATKSKVAEYLEFGTSCVWVIDPEARRAFIHTAAGSHEVTDGFLRNPAGDLSVPLSFIFGS